VPEFHDRGKNHPFYILVSVGGTMSSAPPTSKGIDILYFIVSIFSFPFLSATEKNAGESLPPVYRFQTSLEAGPYKRIA